LHYEEALMAWPGTLRTWLALEKISAVKLQPYSDALNVFDSAWVNYTPTWTGTGGNPAIGNGTITGKKLEAGKFCVASISIVFGSTTTVGTGTYAFGTPSTMRDFNTLGGNGKVTDASAGSAGLFPRHIFGLNSTTFAVALADGTRVAATSPLTWATSDRIDAWFCYEVA
jgi:hypothetical protein